jgi:hypothetical protein
MPDTSAAAASAPAAEAAGSTASTERPQQTPRMPLLVAEEYCETNGQPHFKRTYNDGSVEFESW